ncbi:M81 family metallopeptidase [Gemmata sp.]|uniref:M81 family metallopeptidase n=1 Tax=Gemmata sp. TaxID=1914242 RepID=UPI003F6FD006
MTAAPPVAVGSIFTECNHLGGTPTDLECFARQELTRGPQIFENPSGAVAGMLEVLRERRYGVAPLLVASACPGGPVTADCYRVLKSELLDRLTAAVPVGGVLLALHGSAAVEGLGDLEGDLLQSVRARVGPGVPVVATLDLHAHVTESMVRSADALVAWETYPHRDALTTGRRGARLLLDTVEGKIRPAMALAKVPVLVSGVHGHTEGPGPFADVMRFAKSLEGEGGVVSTSAFLVHPYLDLPDMGGGGLVVTDGDPDTAVALATEIARRYWERRFDLDPPIHSPAEAIARGLAVDGGPVLLVETADCCGGGAAGDSVHALRALLDAKVGVPTLVPVVDPEAAARCHRAGVGQEVTLTLGFRLDPRWGQPLTVTGRVARLSGGTFRYTGGIWSGQDGDMGPSAVLSVGGVHVLVTTHATYDWADEQFQSVGLHARDAKFVVVKNPMNYRLAYAGVSRAAFVLDTPGPTPAVMRKVAYRNLARPYYPADRDIPGLVPRVHTNSPR